MRVGDVSGILFGPPSSILHLCKNRKLDLLSSFTSPLLSFAPRGFPLCASLQYRTPRPSSTPLLHEYSAHSPNTPRAPSLRVPCSASSPQRPARLRLAPSLIPLLPPPYCYLRAPRAAADRLSPPPFTCVYLPPYLATPALASPTTLHSLAHSPAICSSELTPSPTRMCVNPISRIISSQTQGRHP